MKMIATGISWLCGLIAVVFGLHALYTLVTGGGWTPLTVADAFAFIFGTIAFTNNTALILVRSMAQAIPAFLFFGLIAIGIGNLADRMKDDDEA